MSAPAGKHFYTEEKNRFRTDPEKFLEYRKKVDGVMQERFPIFLRSHQLREATIPMITELVKVRVGPDREDKIFTPIFSPGCRLPTRDSSWESRFCTLEKTSWKLSLKTSPELYLAKSACS
ncbi:hypothetical protein DTO271G3_3954 [Paecilomyces variotii]|nr:hypothetical protein DTO271G3_3954 [Paecilomyces variotii]